MAGRGRPRKQHPVDATETDAPATVKQIAGFTRHELSTGIAPLGQFARGYRAALGRVLMKELGTYADNVSELAEALDLVGETVDAIQARIKSGE